LPKSGEEYASNGEGRDHKGFNTKCSWPSRRQTSLTSPVKGSSIRKKLKSWRKNRGGKDGKKGEGRWCGCIVFSKEVKNCFLVRGLRAISRGATGGGIDRGWVKSKGDRVQDFRAGLTFQTQRKGEKMYE